MLFFCKTPEMFGELRRQNKTKNTERGIDVSSMC